MFVRVYKYIFARVLYLLLFFSDFKVVPLCFTILTAVILVLKSTEERLFLGENIYFPEILQKVFLCITVYIFFSVSQGVSRGVQKIFTDIFLFLIIGILVSFSIYSVYVEKAKKEEEVHSFIGKNILLRGTVISKDGENQYTLKTENEFLGDVVLKVSQYSVIHVGQSCSVSGKLVKPESFEDFDYKKYLFRKGIYSILEVDEYECFDRGNRLLLTRSSIENVVDKSMPEPESSLMVGILFGSKRVFTKEFSNSLQASGLSHIVSASGYNVALLASFVDRLFKGVNGRVVCILKISFIWIFALFAGLSSSLVRASTMSSIYFFALLLGRDVSKGILILFCITVLVVLNPFVIHDIGFLLSSSATVGLIFFPKCFECKYVWVKDTLLPTVTCALFTLPVVIYFFGKISVVSILSNLLAAPIVQSTIYWGLLVTILNMLSESLQFLYFLPYVQLNIFRYIVEISSVVDPINIETNTESFVCLLVLLLFFFCLFKYPISDENYYWKKSKGILKYSFLDSSVWYIPC